MIAVIFEVWPADGRKDQYLDHAARLRDTLIAMDGFISVERFQSLTEPGKMLSLSFWRDEQAVAGWRTQIDHRKTQAAGRAGIFRDYRLRVPRIHLSVLAFFALGAISAARAKYAEAAYAEVALHFLLLILILVAAGAFARKPDRAAVLAQRGALLLVGGRLRPAQRELQALRRPRDPER